MTSKAAAKRIENSRDPHYAIRQATEAARDHGSDRFVVRTYYGLAVDTCADINGGGYRVTPDGNVWQLPETVARLRDGAQPVLITAH